MLLSNTGAKASSTAICLCTKVAGYASQWYHCRRAQSWCKARGGRDLKKLDLFRPGSGLGGWCRGWLGWGSKQFEPSPAPHPEKCHCESKMILTPNLALFTWWKWSVWLFCHPMDCSSPGSSVHEILQARKLEWVAIPFSGGSSQPRDELKADSLPSLPPVKPL